VLFEELLFDDERFVALLLVGDLDVCFFMDDELLALVAVLLLLEGELVIFPRVVLVFLALDLVDVFGISLVSVLFVFSRL
jgi:hypothetical protein